MKIAIDGPSGAGKSSLARAVAKKLQIIYVDTGALYRSLGYYAKEHGISADDTAAVIAMLQNVSLEMKFEGGEQHIYLDGRVVGDEIRTPEISMYASKVSAIPEVRTFLLETQRQIARTNDVIMDGRDIGTVILPDADVKIFLTASDEARAKRRLAELLARGIDTTFEDVLSDMRQRDKNDSTRAVAPAVQAPDATLLDNSDMTAEESVLAAVDIIRRKIPEKKKKTKSSFYTRLHFLVAGLIRFLLRVKPVGAENVQNGGAVLCSNHISFADVIVIAVSLPRNIRMRFLAKAELFKIPLLAPLIRALGAYSLDRSGSDVGTIKKSIEIAQSGEIVVAFPQGHRYAGQNPADTPIKNGVGMIAYRAEVPMIPVCVKVKGAKYGIFRRVNVIFGQPIPYSELGFQNGGSDEYRNATEKVFSKICELGGYVKGEELK